MTRIHGRGAAALRGPRPVPGYFLFFVRLVDRFAGFFAFAFFFFVAAIESLHGKETDFQLGVHPSQRGNYNIREFRFLQES